MSWPRSLLLLLIGPFTVGVAAQTTDEPALTLDAAVERALERAPEVVSQLAGVEAAQALAVSSGRLPDPELVLGIDNLPVTGSDAYSTTRDFMTMRKVGLMQEFPRGEKRRLERRRADAATELAGAELVQTRLAIAREVAQAWIRRATAETSLADLRALEPEVELQAAAARAAVAAGRSSTAEALAAEAAVAQLANRILGKQSEARRAAFELARWIHVDASRPLGAMPSLDRLPTPAAALLANVHQHGTLLPYESRMAALRLEVELAKAERRPDWSAELAFAKRGPEFSDMVSLGFRIGLPLFPKYRQNPVITARNAELRELEAEREAELRMHTAALRQMLTDWELLGEQVKQYERDILPLARERSRAALASYRAGRGDLILALDAFEQEIDAVIEHAELQNERGNAWAYLRYLEERHLRS